MTTTDDAGVHAVTCTDHVWIDMPDGVRLAARIWVPDGAGPVPAIFEYIPYRKADMVRARDERTHPFFAAHGFACLRVDMRGSGDSDGHMPDMYSAHELSDARHVIAWIAAQPWCDGNVGMFGTSWGGTASLQATVNAPDALKAVIAVCATHDRYTDDIHHMGGCLLTDTFEWGATLPAILAAPPTPNVGPDWRARWAARLEALSFPVEHWVREEGRGTYWRHGSVVHQAQRLSRPVLAIGGWSDRYANSVMALVSARPDLVRGVIGPWGHHYPDHGHPGPAMGFQQLALDWWRRWLRPGGARADWPHLRVWQAGYDVPADALATRSGRWIETGPPETETGPATFHLSAKGLSKVAGSAGKWDVPADLRVGMAAGDTGYFGRYGGLPTDQRQDDARALVFETAPLEADLPLYGAPVARLDLNVGDGPQQLCLRLSDVAADGTVSRVCLGIRNLALDAALDAPAEPFASGPRSITLTCPTAAYTFAKGHRIRLALSGSYWPLIWPAPRAAGLQVLGGALTLPVLQASGRAPAQPLPPARDLPAIKSHETLCAPPLRRHQQEGPDGWLVTGWDQPFTEVYYTDTDTAFGYETQAAHRIRPDDPTSAASRIAHWARYRRPDGTAQITSTLDVTCDAQTIYLDGRLHAEWDGAKVAEKHWTHAIPRRYG